MTTFSETTLPALIFSVPAGHPKGDVPALGRLTVNEAQAVDQWWVTWGLETNDDYTHTDSTGSGALFYEAETRTALGGSATAVGPSGASGAGSNVMRNTALPTDWVGLVSTQATGGGAHLSHVGTFRVYARVQVPNTNSGTVSLALEWAVGDFRNFTRNDTVTVAATTGGTWQLRDLGLVNIAKVLTGTQRWEGRIIAKSTVANEDIDIDYLMLIPTTASGVASGVFQIPASSTFINRDEFDQTAGALAGKTAPIGGTWAGAGDTDDFNVSGSGSVTRTAVSDSADTGRYAVLGSTSYAGMIAQVDVSQNAQDQPSPAELGLIARYVDTSNWLQVSMVSSAVRVRKRVAGTITTLFSGGVGIPSPVTATVTPRILVDTAGRWYLWVASSQNPGVFTLQASGQDAVLATGGALASGKIGLYDESNSATAITRTYDNFYATAFSTDAAMFASQSMEIRYDGVQREDSAGAIWQPVSSYTGDLLRAPVTGREGRSVRFIVKACRNDPAVGADAGIDDINATLAVTPRYLSVPAPS